MCVDSTHFEHSKLFIEYELEKKQAFVKCTIKKLLQGLKVYYIMKSSQYLHIEQPSSIASTITFKIKHG